MKKFNYNLFFVIVLSLLIPTIYKTVRIYFLGYIPTDWGFNIASQLAWINVLYEIIQEAIILPLFFLIGKSISNSNELTNKLKTGLLISFFIYALMSLFLFVFAKQLLIFMGQKSELIEKSTTYIQYEAIAILISILYRFIMIVFLALNKTKTILLLLFIQMFFTIILDLFLMSPYSFSMKLGVMGIVISNIMVNIFLFFISIWLINKYHLKIFNKMKLSFIWMKEWFKIGGLSGLESLVRNVIFILMILKMINLIEEQGNFWLANSFIWGWLLIPITALGELIKRNTGNNPEKIKSELPIYFSITSIIIVLWLISIPLWDSFMRNVMNIENSETVLHVVLISIIFYIFYAYNNIIDSIFYGLGRTDLMLLQSLSINLFYYGIIYILYKKNIFTPTLDTIAIVFGLGIILDSLLTFYLFYFLNKKNRLINNM